MENFEEIAVVETRGRKQKYDYTPLLIVGGHMVFKGMNISNVHTIVKRFLSKNVKKFKIRCWTDASDNSVVVKRVA